ncbi:hypothetical protein QNO07_09455 [Streptomyces sp. 549]|uniref:hypothetical protein n=1 Tax=Streptomyces sp. 549 TaxID=3049076 RepID=UPI0024C21A65|nr:hypothetical protein [Streptomyces sp. 549]MDK1473645.1 hypothetical protein [Streptomyces sp. 549]
MLPTRNADAPNPYSEQQRGDNTVQRIVERLDTGQPVQQWQAAARDAYTNAAHGTTQPKAVA